MSSGWFVDDSELEEWIDDIVRKEASIRKITLQNMANLGEFTRLLCRIELEDTRYTGAMIESFIVELNVPDLSAAIFPTASHSIFVRTGTRPHWAPIGPLKRWAAAKLGDEQLAYPVQWSIKEFGTSVFQQRKRGTKSNPWPTRVVSRPDFQQALRRTVDELGGAIATEIVL